VKQVITFEIMEPSVTNTYFEKLYSQNANGGDGE
jgi:hypothetical protein